MNGVAHRILGNSAGFSRCFLSGATICEKLEKLEARNRYLLSFNPMSDACLVERQKSQSKAATLVQDRRHAGHSAYLRTVEGEQGEAFGEFAPDLANIG